MKAPYTERYVRCCERTAVNHRLLLDYVVHISICLAVLFTADCQPMLVFFLCSQSAPDMPFGFVDVQHYSGLGGEGWVDVFQTIGDILMFGRYYLELFDFHIRLPLKCFHLIPNHLIIEGKYPHFHLCLLRFS